MKISKTNNNSSCVLKLRTFPALLVRVNESVRGRIAAASTVYPSICTPFCAFRKIKDLDYAVLILKMSGILQQIPLNIAISTAHSQEKIFLCFQHHILVYMVNETILKSIKVTCYRAQISECLTEKGNIFSFSSEGR